MTKNNDEKIEVTFIFTLLYIHNFDNINSLK